MSLSASPLSASPIWQAQRDYYAKQKIESWRQQVPFYATSNAYMAHVYARLIEAFILDRHKLGFHDPVTIIELGAGSGQLSYLLLQQLSANHAVNSSDWHYVMTDAEPALIDFWRSHLGFTSYLSDSQLEMLVWDIGHSFPGAIEAYGKQGSVIFIANYVFDSLPADIYHIQDESIFPVYVSIDSSLPIDDFSTLKIKFEPQGAITTDDPVLSHYRQNLLNSTILYPSATCQFLASLYEMSRYGALILCSDKAYIDLDELDGLSNPELTPHNGCFSMMVNMDALKRWCDIHGGFAYLPSRRSGLKTVLLGLGLSKLDCRQLLRTASGLINAFSPGQYLEIYKQARLQVNQLSLEAWTSYLALSHWDPTLFLHAYRRIIDQLDGSDMLSVDYLLDHLDKIAQQVYWLPFNDDIWFMLGVLCHELKRYAQAAGYYQQSLQYYPAVFGVYFNLAVCQVHCGMSEAAIVSFQAAEQLDPGDKRTQAWLSRLSA